MIYHPSWLLRLLEIALLIHQTHPTSLVIREKQIKTTMRYPYTSYRMAKMKKTENSKSWQGYRATAILKHCWWEYNYFGKLVGDIYLS